MIIIYRSRLAVSLRGLYKMSGLKAAVWRNNVFSPNKVRPNGYYYRHYSFVKDIQVILCTVLGRKMRYAGEEI